MPNSFDMDGRGPSDHHLLGGGIALLLIAAVITGALLVKSTGSSIPMSGSSPLW